MNQITPAVKNILIITFIVFFAQQVLRQFDFNAMFGLHYFQSNSFRIWQFLSFIFLHADFSHIFFNMFALFMFGSVIEQVLGTQRFVTYYLVAGIGSGIIQQVALYVDMQPFYSAVNEATNNISTQTIEQFLGKWSPNSLAASECVTRFINEYNTLLRAGNQQEAVSVVRSFLDSYSAMWPAGHCTIGASGAVFALLLAFGMLFPNNIIYFMMLLPIKAKYFVVLYGLAELYYGVNNFSGDQVAHWAHLGGMLFGFIMIKYWRIQRYN